MFFWINFSNIVGTIGTIFGLLVLASVSLMIVVTLWRAMMGSNREALEYGAAMLPVAGNVEQRPARLGLLTRMTVGLGTAFGSISGWWLQSNNRRARAILLILTVLTCAFIFLYLPYAYHHAQPNGLRNAVLTETFGQQTLSDKSMTRSAYIPNPDEYFGFTSAKVDSAPKVSSDTSNAVASSKGKSETGKKSTTSTTKNVQAEYAYSGSYLLWLFFWMFAFAPFAWVCAILYAVLSLREETWNGARSMVAKLRDWISNMGESGIRGTRSAGGAQGGLTFSAPIVMTTSGAAAAEAEKPKAEVPWAKIMSWVKRNSGEIVAGLFVIDEILELGAVRRKNRNPRD